MLLRVLLVATTLSVLADRVYATEPLKLDEKLSSLTYGGYRFEKVLDKAGESWSIRVTKNGHLIRTFEDPSAKGLHLDETESHWLSMGVVHALASSQGQVALRIWTGGNHCCYIHWLVEVVPELRVVLDTSAYDVDEVGQARDIDGDGNWEFSFRTFDRFSPGFVFSPELDLWFKYDAKAKKYVPANDLCFAEIQKQRLKDEARLRARPWRKNPAPYNFELKQAVLDVVLPLLYAGHASEAWSIFDREYPNDEKAEERTFIEQRARSDPFFQAVRQPTRATQ